MILTDLRILALEDEPVIALALEDLLLDAGSDPQVMLTIDTALNYLRGSPAIDAAILDVNINGETSYRVAARLAALRVPFIFSSGYGDAIHPQEFAAVPTVAKPYTLAELRRALAVAHRANAPDEQGER